MWVDVAALFFLVIFAILGYLRGLFSQAWSLGALVVSYFAASPVLGVVHQRLGSPGESSLLGEAILKLAVGLGIYVVLLVIGYAIEKALIQRFSLVSAGNRFLGATLGAAKGGLIVVVVLWLVAFFVAGVGTDRASFLGSQVGTSRAAALVAPYNPLNLLLLARVKPYLPVTATGSSRPAVKPPRSVESSPTFQSLVADSSFLEAYRAHDYMDIIRNPSFHRFVQDQALLTALEKSQH